MKDYNFLVSGPKFNIFRLIGSENVVNKMLFRVKSIL